MQQQLNVLGTPLQLCSTEPLTGYQRDGYCAACSGDYGQHTLCASMSKEFLEFSCSRGNDLITAYPAYDFPGLKAGDRWCLCVTRWVEAHEAGCAPQVHLEATHRSVLEYVSLGVLQEFAVHSS